MKLPGPDHPIALTPAKTRWRARFQNHVIADSDDAVILKEASYPEVIYFPRQDVTMAFFSRTERSTYCPYKGQAAYFSLMMDGHIGENAVWTYEDPYPAMAGIRERLAFYANQVEIYEVDDAVVSPHTIHTDIDEAVLHTDSGSGQSQRAHWKE